MLVRILSPRSGQDRQFLFPLRLFRRQLEDLQINVDIQRNVSPRLADADVLLIADYNWRSKERGGTIREDRVEFVQQYADLGVNIIYLDFRDSTGQTSFQILPWVKVYAKRQLLRNVLHYGTNEYTTAPAKGAHFAAYYHQLLQEPAPSVREPLAPATLDQLGKLDISWNCGLFYWLLHYGSAFRRALHVMFPPRRQRLPVAAPSSARPIDATFRGTVQRGNRIGVSFQRGETLRQLMRLAVEKEYSIAAGGRLTAWQHYQELTQSKVVPSPFGVGEVCFRDFECFSAGAALLKPDMSHLMTWPEYYSPGQTYVAHRWDFSNFEEQLVGLLDGPTGSSRRQEIANEGQERYLRSVSEKGGEAFAQHFARLLRKAAEPSAAPMRAEGSGPAASQV
jgi:hypothetical protein